MIEQAVTFPSAGLKLVATNKFDLAVYYEGDMFYAGQQGLPVIAVGALIPTPLNSMIAKSGSRLRRQRGRIRSRHLSRTDRGYAQRADLPGAASRGRSAAHRPHRLELRRGGRNLHRWCRRARRRDHLQRRLGRRRAQVPRPAQEPRGVGALHQYAERRPRAPRPYRQVADGAALRDRADPAASARQSRQQLGPVVPGGDRAEHVRLPRRRRGRPHHAATPPAPACRQRFGDPHRAVD